MRSAFFLVVSVWSACFFFPLASFAAEAASPPLPDARQTLSVPVGRAAAFAPASAMVEVTVADPEVADLYVHGPLSLSIYGKRIGRTSIEAAGLGGKPVAALDIVVTPDFPSIRQAIAETIPPEGERITVDMQAGALTLSGQVGDSVRAEAVVRAADQALRRQVGASAILIVNQLQVVSPASMETAGQRRRLPIETAFLDAVKLAGMSGLEGPVGYMVE